MRLTRTFNRFIEVLKQDLPHTDRILEFSATEEPAVTVKGEKFEDVGWYKDVTVRVRFGFIPPNTKPVKKLEELTL